MPLRNVNIRKQSTGTFSDHGSTDTGSLFGDHIEETQNAASVNAQNEILLKALQGFIVPLIRVGLRDRKRTNGINQMTSGPEAQQLITALQGFITSIIGRSQSVAHNTVEVPLDGDFQDDVDNGGIDNGSSDEENSEPEFFLSDSDEDVTDYDDFENKRISSQWKQKFQDKAIRALRDHVFNKMPIRLLSFERRGSTLQITLLEREAVYQRLKPRLEAKMEEPGFRPNLISVGSHQRMEPDREFIDELVNECARYAIFSHTWLRTPGSAEVTYSDWNKGIYDVEHQGYQKLVNFCKTAWKNHGLTFGWMDTVCINKESSSEHDESIRSMYAWYSRARVCIIYLAETEILSNMHEDSWFTRGWTLQELLAPDFIKFYDNDWMQLGQYSDENDKDDKEITNEIELATSISVEELNDIHSAPISRRMELAGKRMVTRAEDSAYCLMGIFNVSISTAYGEGSDRAFFRLLQEILVSSERVLDIFNWGGGLPGSRPHSSLLLPISPRSYSRRSSDSKLLLAHLWPMEPLTLTHQGLRVPVILMPGFSTRDTKYKLSPMGDYYAIVRMSPYNKAIPTTYALLAIGVSGSDVEHKNASQRTFAVFNFSGDATSIRISKTCIAVCLECDEKVGKVSALGFQKKFPTREPIVFELNKTTTSSKIDSGGDDDDENSEYYQVKRSKLAMHGKKVKVKSG